MLRAVIISPDTELGSRLGEMISRSGRIGLVRTADRYMEEFELDRFLRANAPQVVFLSIEQLNRAIEMLRCVEKTLPGTQVVAIDRACDPAVLLDLMHIGVREFLAYPFEGANFMAAIARIEETLERRPAKLDISDNVFSFLPSKTGAGTTTVCLNAAVALSRLNKTNILLMDLDLNQGLVGFMLKLDTGYTIYEAADNATKLDEHLWPQLVANRDNLDILPAGRLDPQTRIDPLQIRQLIAFARRFYNGICIDLSGNMEKFSLEVMQESKRVFIVCTPEIPSLHLARQKLTLLQGMDLGERVAVLLNRSQRRPIISPAHIEQLLGVPVYQEFPNDYRGVHEALTSGREIDSQSELGRQFVQLAHSMMNKNPPKTPRGQKKKFLEFFSITSKPAEAGQ